MEEESGGVFGLGGPKRIILHLGPALPGKSAHYNNIKILVGLLTQ